MAKEKDKKIKKVDKTLNRKLKIEQHEPHKNNGVRLVVSSQLP
jgi:hypothetical protein